MPSTTLSILSISVDRITDEEVLEKIKRSLSGKPQILPIVSINPEIVMLTDKQPAYRSIINNAYLRLPDGIGIVLAAKVLGLPKLTRITGIALIKKLAGRASNWSVPIGLIGGKPGAAVKAGECLSKANLELNWWAGKGPTIRMTDDKLSGGARSRSARQITNKSKAENSKDEISKLAATSLSARQNKIGIKYLDPYTSNASYDFKRLIERINQTNTQILFCAFGAPKQEFFVEELKKYENKLKQPLITISVGGAFDELAGMVSPAPAWIDKLGFKWFWRLAHEPWRFRRQLRLISFFYFILSSKITRLKE